MDSSSSSLDPTELVDIPIVDLSSADRVVAQELVRAFRQIGFATLVHHGVPFTTIRNGFAASQRFFGLPMNTKLQYKYQSHTSNRGYISMGSETFESSSLKAQPDRKETFDIGKEGEAGFQTPWPQELNPYGFKDDLLQYFQEFDALNLRIMKLLAIGLGLPNETFLVNRCNEQHCNLRLLHYPELHRTDDDTSTLVRGAVHTDFGSITLLSQDNVGGLRVQRLDGAWIGVKPVEGSIIVNVGDMLERWTNGFLTATPHQVIDLPQYKNIVPERYSIAFFCNVNKEVVLDPMTSLNDEPSKYEPVKAIDYITMRLSQTISSS